MIDMTVNQSAIIAFVLLCILVKLTLKTSNGTAVFSALVLTLLISNVGLVLDTFDAMRDRCHNGASTCHLQVGPVVPADGATSSNGAQSSSTPGNTTTSIKP